MKADEYTSPDARGYFPLLLCRVALGFSAALGSLPVAEGIDITCWNTYFWPAEAISTIVITLRRSPLAHHWLLHARLVEVSIPSLATGRRSTVPLGSSLQLS